MSLNKDEVLMVGDNLMTDILGANRVGIKSVGLTVMIKNEMKLYRLFEIKHLEELFAIIEGITK